MEQEKRRRSRWGFRSRSRRRRRAAWRRLARRLLITGIFLALYGLAILQAAAIVQRKAAAARTKLTSAERLAKELDFKGARAELLSARSDIKATRSPIVRALLGPPAHLPFVGNSFKAVDRMSSAALDIAAGAGTMIDTLAPLGEKERLKVSGGRFPDVPWDDLASAAERAGRFMESAQRKVVSVPTRSLLPKIRDLRGEMVGQIEDVATALGRLELGAQVASRIFDGDKTVLVVLQNSSEMRATGGYPDDMITFTLRDRRFRLGEAHFDTGLTPPQVATFRRLLVDPDFPTSARGVTAFARDTWGIKADLVLSLDTVGVASLLDITGPVQSGTVTLTKASYVKWSTVDVYKQYPSPPIRHGFESLVIASLMDKLLTSDSDISRVGAVMGEMARQKHLMFWSPDNANERAFRALEVAGSFSPLRGEATIAVFGNALNREWSKLAPFSTRSLRYAGTLGVNGELQAQLAVTVTNDPPDLPAYLLGPLGDYFFRTDLSVFGMSPGESRFIVPRKRALTRTFSQVVKTTPHELVLHYFHQPLVSAANLDVRIAVPTSVRIGRLEGFVLRNGYLEFTGKVAGDLVLRAAYS